MSPSDHRDGRKTEHHPDSRRFTLALPEGEARLEYRELADGRIDMFRTYVPPAARGRGIAAALVRRALAWAREHHARVVPTCSFVRRYVTEHPDEADLAD